MAAPPPVLPNAQRWRDLLGSPLPELAQIAAARRVNAAIQAAPTVSSSTKLTAQAGLAAIEKELDDKLGPAVDVLARQSSLKKTNEFVQRDVLRRQSEVEARRPGPNATAGEVASFNADMAPINADLEAIHQKITRDNATFDKAFAAALATVDQFLNARAGAYVQAGQAILAGTKDGGLAVRQLRGAEAGARDHVFDNTPAPPSAVDSRNTPKQPVDQRAKELQKPTVQPYAHPPKTTDKAPPPPPPAKK